MLSEPTDQADITNSLYIDSYENNEASKPLFFLFPPYHHHWVTTMQTHLIGMIHRLTPNLLQQIFRRTLIMDRSIISMYTFSMSFHLWRINNITVFAWPYLCLVSVYSWKLIVNFCKIRCLFPDFIGSLEEWFPKCSNCRSKITKTFMMYVQMKIWSVHHRT